MIQCGIWVNVLSRRQTHASQSSLLKQTYYCEIKEDSHKYEEPSSKNFALFTRFDEHFEWLNLK